MNLPTLSVLMCNYNHGHFVGEALHAILSQSLRPTEVIVLDDGSTDNSVEILEGIAKRDPLVRLVRNDTNRGGMYSTGRVLGMATGDYIYCASADDRVLPGLFEKSMRMLARHPQAGLCCSDPASFTDGTEFVPHALVWSPSPRCFSPAQMSRVIRGGFIYGHTSVIHRTALIDAGGLIPELRWHCDWFALHVIAARRGICYIPECLAAMRHSPVTYSSAGRRNLEAQRTVLAHLLSLLDSPPYRDVRPFFQSGDLLAHFAPEILGMLLRHPRHWRFVSSRMLDGAWWSDVDRCRRSRRSSGAVGFAAMATLGDFLRAIVPRSLKDSLKGILRPS